LSVEKRRRKRRSPDLPHISPVVHGRREDRGGKRDESESHPLIYTPIYVGEDRRLRGEKRAEIKPSLFLLMWEKTERKKKE